MSPSSKKPPHSVFPVHVASTTLLVALAASALGCQPPALLSDRSQACVENALRRSADPQTASEARIAFQEGCARGEMEACSALGVLTEVGFGRPGDALAASELYGRACAGGNARACANLGVLHAQGKVGEASVARALPFFNRACDANDPLGCAELGRLYAEGKDVRQNPTMADMLFDRACEAGEARACTARGKMLLATDARDALALLTRACVGGEREACLYLEQSDPHAPVKVADTVRAGRVASN